MWYVMIIQLFLEQFTFDLNLPHNFHLNIVRTNMFQGLIQKKNDIGSAEGAQKAAGGLKVHVYGRALMRKIFWLFDIQKT